MSQSQETTSPRAWALRLVGLVLLGYTFFMTFTVPLGPGIEDVRVSRTELTKDGGVYEVEILGHGTHFTTSEPRVFLRRGDNVMSATAIKASNDESLKCRIRLPKFVPAASFDVFVNGKQDGTISYANGFFATGLEAVAKAKFPANEAILANLEAADLDFHFPFQPNIMESIRNLMLHVPMWFTMFLLMGISFAQSIRTLRVGGDLDGDQRAVSAVKVGLWFGVLGLLTGSLWARFTWGAWWVDDPQLNGAFVTVMVYAGYLVLRGSIQDAKLRSRLSAVYNLFGFFLLVVLLMVLPRFTESLHPGKGGNPAFSSYDLDSALRAAFYPAVLGWMILGTWMYRLQLRIEQTRERLAEAQLTKSSMPLALLFVPPASTSSLETVFMASGKMPVVVGVAVIILAGLGLWWLRTARTLQRLSEEENTLNGTHNA